MRSIALVENHIVDMPSYKKRVRANLLWWYGGEIFSLYGPVPKGGWSKDKLTYQVEVLLPKIVRVVDDGSGTLVS